MFRNLNIKTKRLRGLTLTEVIVASTLLTIATIPVLKGLTSANLNSAIIERKTRSLTLARAKLSGINARSIYDYSSSFTENNTSLDGSYLCNVVDSSINSNLRAVTVKVGYDLNRDSSLADNEVEVVLNTAFAKRW